MQQDKFRDLIPFYVARTLSPTDQREFEARLAVDEALRRDTEEWRVIAAAVWREADTVARKLPPLSPEVYQRLAYRGKTPQSTYPGAAPGEPTLRQPRVRLTQTTSLPLTLVAGLLLAFVFGGLLVLLAVNMNNRPQPILVAENFTGTPLPGDGGFGAGATTTGTPSPVSTDFGILQASPGVLIPPTDTPGALSTTVIVIPQPQSTPTPDGVGGGGTEDFTQTMLIAGTPNPNLLLVATPLPGECLVINAGNMPVQVYRAANSASDLVMEMLPGEQYRSIVQTADGWYELFLGAGRTAWVFGLDVTAAGECLTLPIASPTAMPTMTLIPIVLTMPATVEMAIVSAPFADLRNGPTVAYEVISTVPQNTQFAVRGYYGEGDNRWIFTVLNDGREAWLSALAVQILPIGDITPPPDASQ